MSNGNVETKDKILWTPEEASQMTGIGINKIRDLCDVNPSLVLWNGKRRLIKRKVFEEYLNRERGV